MNVLRLSCRLALWVAAALCMAARASADSVTYTTPKGERITCNSGDPGGCDEYLPIAYRTDGPGKSAVMVESGPYGRYQGAADLAPTPLYIEHRAPEPCKTMSNPAKVAAGKLCMPTPLIARQYPPGKFEIWTSLRWIKGLAMPSAIVFNSKNLRDFVDFTTTPFQFELCAPDPAKDYKECDAKYPTQRMSVRFQISSDAMQTEARRAGGVGSWLDDKQPTARAYCDDPPAPYSFGVEAWLQALARDGRVVTPDTSRITNPKSGWIDKEPNITPEQYKDAFELCGNLPSEAGMPSLGKLVYKNGRLAFSDEFCRPYVSWESQANNGRGACALNHRFTEAQCRHRPDLSKSLSSMLYLNVKFTEPDEVCKYGSGAGDISGDPRFGTPPPPYMGKFDADAPKTVHCDFEWDRPHADFSPAGMRNVNTPHKNYDVDMHITGLDKNARYTLSQVNLNGWLNGPGWFAGQSIDSTITSDDKGEFHARNSSPVKGQIGDYTIRLLDGQREVAVCTGFRIEGKYDTTVTGSALGENTTTIAAPHDLAQSPSAVAEGQACDGAKNGACDAKDGASGAGLMCIGIGAGAQREWRWRRPEAMACSASANACKTALLSEGCPQTKVPHGQRSASCYPGSSALDPLRPKGQDWWFQSELNDVPPLAKAQCEASGVPEARKACTQKAGTCDEKQICMKLEDVNGKSEGFRLYDAAQRLACNDGDKATYADTCKLPDKTAVCVGGGWKFSKEVEGTERIVVKESTGKKTESVLDRTDLVVSGDPADTMGMTTTGGGAIALTNTTPPKNTETPGDPTPRVGGSCDQEFGPCNDQLVCLKVERDGTLLIPFKLYSATDAKNRPSGQPGDMATFSLACPFARQKGQETAFLRGGTDWVFEREWTAVQHAGDHPGQDEEKRRGGGGGGPSASTCDPSTECLRADKNETQTICLGSVDAGKETWTRRGPVDLKNGVQPSCAKDERVSYGAACQRDFNLQPGTRATCVEDGHWRLDSPDSAAGK